MAGVMELMPNKLTGTQPLVGAARVDAQTGAPTATPATPPAAGFATTSIVGPKAHCCAH